MAAIAVQAVTASGLALSTAAASAGGDTLANDGKTLLVVVNSHSAAWTVTITAPFPCNHGSIHSVAFSVGAGVTRYFGPFSPARFGDPIAITYSGVTALAVGAMTT